MSLVPVYAERLVALLKAGRHLSVRQASRELPANLRYVQKMIRDHRQAGNVYVVGWDTTRRPWVRVYAWRDAGQRDARRPRPQSKSEEMRLYRARYPSKVAAEIERKRLKRARQVAPRKLAKLAKVTRRIVQQDPLLAWRPVAHPQESDE